MGSIKGYCENHLADLHCKYTEHGCSARIQVDVSKLVLETKEDLIEIRLMCEMMPLKSSEGRCVNFHMHTWERSVQDVYDDTEQLPKLLCLSASEDIDMRNRDLFRFSGKPGACNRGGVTCAVDENDLRKLMETDPQLTEYTGESDDETLGSEWRV